MLLALTAMMVVAMALSNLMLGMSMLLLMSVLTPLLRRRQEHAGDRWARRHVRGEDLADTLDTLVRPGGRGPHAAMG